MAARRLRYRVAFKKALRLPGTPPHRGLRGLVMSSLTIVSEDSINRMSEPAMVMRSTMLLPGVPAPQVQAAGKQCYAERVV
jgi:hypothetical protein